MKGVKNKNLSLNTEDRNTSEMTLFFEQIKSLLSDDKNISSERKPTVKRKHMMGECTYVTDFREKKILDKMGFFSLLGFKDDEVSFDFVFKGYHHEDAALIKQIIKTVVYAAVNSNNSDPDLQLSLTYRRKRKDGSYIHLLCQLSVHEVGSRGNLLKSFTRLTDISYLNLNTPVSWSIRSRNMAEEEVSKSIHDLFINPFTKREIEVIKEIEKGGSNQEIADRLFISRHTIATHRKNIFRKCNCNTVLDLLLYCKKLDII